MTQKGALSAGGFSAWLRELRTALLEGGAVSVPCGDCAACCSSSYFIHVGAAETAALARVPAELLFPAPGARDALLLGYDRDGRCPMLSGRLCSIYDSRPLTCRLYDCRVFAAAGIAADREAITRQSRRWVFDHPSKQDRREHDAVLSAARFLREQAPCFPGGAAPTEPADVAITAVKAYEVFLDTPDGYDQAARSAAGQAVARAVVQANERFEAAGPHGRGREGGRKAFEERSDED